MSSVQLSSFYNQYSFENALGLKASLYHGVRPGWPDDSYQWLWWGSTPRSKTISQTGIDIRVPSELVEERMLVVSEEDVSTQFNGPMVVDLVRDVRT